MTNLRKAEDFVSNSQIRQLMPDELAHHGVQGMHWGKHLPGKTEASHNPKAPRKVQFEGEHSGPTKKKYPVKASSDHVESRELLQKKTHELSNADIKRITERLQKEQNLKKLNPSKVEQGKKVVLGIIAAGTLAVSVYNLVNSPAGKAGVANGKKVVESILAKSA